MCDAVVVPRVGMLVLRLMCGCVVLVVDLRVGMSVVWVLSLVPVSCPMLQVFRTEGCF